MEKITYRLDTVKDKVKVFIKNHYYDYCSDMMADIKAACNNNDIDNIEMFVDSIRGAEKLSVRHIEQVDEALCIADILLIASDDAIYNALFEQEDMLLTAMFDVKIEQQWLTQ